MLNLQSHPARTSCLVGFILAFLFPVGNAIGEAPPAKPAPSPDAIFTSQIVPFLKKHCLECHSSKTPDSEIQFDTYKTAAAIEADAKTWQRVLEMLQSSAMPPDDRPQPTAEERKRIVEWIEKTIYQLDCDGVPDPGRVTIRRLNRAEYNNTVRDLLGVTFRPADDFPSDDVGSGFDNQGEVLSLPPLLLEKYLASAEKISAAAIVADPSSLVEKQRQGRRMEAIGPTARAAGRWCLTVASKDCLRFLAPANTRCVRLPALKTSIAKPPNWSCAAMVRR
jgi:hypothetical protein